ncbi:MAG: hypothetical protein A4E70_00966 [Syntrophus sp. PtaU1.Bin005]|nr:MAG: hypothetical protein A4E69_02682 [Syntrophus sp. PtaB.Bin138]OPY81990.1 MAG: hypothetical protein A4E70_00966 [Syntrophus sp. PtaU1.Bin005]
MSENTVIKIPEDTFSSGVYDAKIALGVLHLIVKNHEHTPGAFFIIEDAMGRLEDAISDFEFWANEENWRMLNERQGDE